MKASHALAIVVFTIMALLLISCTGIGRHTPNPEELDANDRQEDKTTILMTKEELLLYVKNNEINLTEEAFEGIDIEAMIERFQITEEAIEWHGLDRLLKLYKDSIASEQRDAIYAKEIKNVDSKDEEYRAFVDVFFEAVGEEYSFGGTDKIYLFDEYIIRKDDETYIITIGKTKNMDTYRIVDSNLPSNKKLIHLPYGDGAFRRDFCYSPDGKFFMFIDGKYEFAYKLMTLFTQTSTPQQ